MLPIDALHQAFESYPPLRMRLLEELAREVSRAYITCCLTRVTPARRHATERQRQDDQSPIGTIRSGRPAHWTRASSVPDGDLRYTSPST